MIIFSILRLVYSDTHESMWPEVSALSLWSAIESSIAVIIVNIIEFKLLFSINLGNGASTTYPPLNKERSSTLPPTLRTSVMSPALMSPPPPAATSAEPAAQQPVTAQRNTAVAVPYTPDPGPTRYSPPVFSDASNPGLHTHFAPSTSGDRTPSRRWSDPSSHDGMEEIIISHDLDDLHAEIVAREEMLAMEPSIYRDAMTMTDDGIPRTHHLDDETIAENATADDLVIQGRDNPQGSHHELASDQRSNDSIIQGINDLIIQGNIAASIPGTSNLIMQANAELSNAEQDDADAGLEGYDLGGLSYYIPTTPEAHRTSFYNV
jgi:hypothetical protein